MQKIHILQTQIIKLCLLSFLIALTGCVKENISPEFKKYVEMFVEEAAKRGRKLTTDNLVINFNPDKQKASQCVTGSPTILINENGWNVANDLLKEKTIFHEMGHCILGLKHNNCLLPDGTSESIMCGMGGNCLSEYCFIPYGGMRRDYYLDQLFSENPIQAPKWSRLEEFNDETIGKKRISLITEEFNYISKIDITTTKTYSISNSKFNINGTSAISFKNGIKDELNQDNIEIETSFKNEGNEGDSFSLQWFPKPKNTTLNSYFIGIFYKNGETLLLLTINGIGGYQKKITGQIKIDEFNKLKITRLDNMYYFYLNEKLVYIQDFVNVTLNPPSVEGKDLSGQIVLFTSGKCSIDYVKINKITL